jgi:uncharacterized phage protein (TIGR02218 family)
MKDCSAALAAHLPEDVTRLATLWRLTRTDETVMGFTDHDRDLAVDGLTYRAATGFTPTSIASSSGLSVDNLDIQSVLDSAEITEADLRAGVYDYATIEVRLVDHGNPGNGSLFLRKGTLGQVKMSGPSFVAELRGMTQAFANQIGQLYTPTCRADLGDDRCGVDLTGITVSGIVQTVTSQRRFADPRCAQPDGWFRNGLVTWTGGANAGLSMEVRAFSAGAFDLFLPMARPIVPGDTYKAQAGCNKLFDTCRDKFANSAAFRGEPHVPGTDFLTTSAGD